MVGNHYVRQSLLLISLLLMLSTTTAIAQTSSFTYQGRLTDGGPAANGTYDLQFLLFDSPSGGAQVGATQTVSNVPVSAGIFSVLLDFGANAFPSAPRFLEINARLTGSPSFTTLSPRQPITSTPYAIRSLNASTADAVTAGATITGNTINATTRFSLSGISVLSTAGSGNLFIGFGAGQAAIAEPTPGASGNNNTIVGMTAGASNTTGRNNSIFGWEAGNHNTTGSNNSFFGFAAGDLNNGDLNAFFGDATGELNTSGSRNSFFGSPAGFNNSTGSRNSFFGTDAGSGNTTGSRNTFIGSLAVPGTTGLTNATAIGANAQVDQDNSLILGSIALLNSATADTHVGIGTTSPTAKLTVSGAGAFNAFGAARFDLFNTTAGTGFLQHVTNTGLLQFATTGGATRMVIDPSGNVGIGAVTPVSTLDIRGNLTLDSGSSPTLFTSASSGEQNRYLSIINSPSSQSASGLKAGGILVADSFGYANPGKNELVVKGRIKVGDLGISGDTQLCRNGINEIALCGVSSLRYKKNIRPFALGLELITRLQPIAFNWKEDGRADLGLAAEDVAKVAPSFAFTNNKGEVEGVKYDRLSVILINAVKQQQKEIEMLRTQNAGLNVRLQSVEKSLSKRLRPARRRG